MHDAKSHRPARSRDECGGLRHLLIAAPRRSFDSHDVAGRHSGGRPARSRCRQASIPAPLLLTAGSTASTGDGLPAAPKVAKYNGFAHVMERRPPACRSVAPRIVRMGREAFWQRSQAPAAARTTTRGGLRGSRQATAGRRDDAGRRPLDENGWKRTRMLAGAQWTPLVVRREGSNASQAERGARRLGHHGRTTSAPPIEKGVPSSRPALVTNRFAEGSATRSSTGIGAIRQPMSTRPSCSWADMPGVMPACLDR